MMTEEKNRDNKKQTVMIILCWLAYTMVYFGRYGYNANINPIIGEYGVTKAEAGLVPSFFFFAYGIGQVVHGLLCRHYNKRIVVSAVLVLSAAINLAVFFGIPFEYIKFLWLINGFIQSVLWPTILLTLSENLDKAHLKTAVLIMGTTTCAGTLLVYGASAVLVHFEVYKIIFAAGAGIMVLTAAAWFFGLDRVKTERGVEEDGKTLSSPDGTENVGKKKLTFSLFIAVAVLAVFAILANLIKDGTQTWVPTILKETYGLPDSLSILLTLLLPVLGIFGALLAVAINRFVKDFVLLSSVLFAATAAFTALIIIFLGLPYWALVTLCFGVISLLMHSVNNVITSIAPLYLRDKINTGLLAGLLNGFCYVGSTVSSYGLGALSSGDSWNAVFDLFLYCTLGAVVIGVGYFVFTKVKNGKNR